MPSPDPTYVHSIAMSTRAPAGFPWTPTTWPVNSNSEWAKIKPGDLVTAPKIKADLQFTVTDKLYVDKVAAREVFDRYYLVVTIVTKTDAGAAGDGFESIPPSDAPCASQAVDQAFTTWHSTDLNLDTVEKDDDRYARVLFFGSLRVPPPAQDGTDLANSAPTSVTPQPAHQRPDATAFLDALTAKPCRNSRVILNNPNNWVVYNTGDDIGDLDLPPGNQYLPSRFELIALLNQNKHKIAGNGTGGIIDFRKVVDAPKIFGPKESAANFEGKEIIILDQAPSIPSGTLAQGVLVYPPLPIAWCPGAVTYHYTGGNGQNIVLSNQNNGVLTNGDGNFRTTFHSAAYDPSPTAADPKSGASEAYYALPSDIERLGYIDHLNRQEQTPFQAKAIESIKNWLGQPDHRILVTGSSEFANAAISNELQGDAAVRFGALNLVDGLPNVTKDMNVRSGVERARPITPYDDVTDIRVYNYSNTEFTQQDVYSDLIQFSIPGGINTNALPGQRNYTENGLVAPHSWAWIKPPGGPLTGGNSPSSIFMAVRNTAMPTTAVVGLPVESTSSDSAARRECWWNSAGEKRRLFEQQILSVSPDAVAWPTAADTLLPNNYFVKVEKIYDISNGGTKTEPGIENLLTEIACPTSPNNFKAAIAPLALKGQIIIIEICRYSGGTKVDVTSADLNPLTANYSDIAICAGANCGFYGVWKNVRVPKRMVDFSKTGWADGVPVVGQDWPLGLQVGNGNTGTMVVTDKRWTNRPYITIDSITSMLHNDGEAGDIDGTDDTYDGPNQGFKYNHHNGEVAGEYLGYKIIRTPADPNEFIEFHVGIPDENVNAFNNHHHENIMIPVGIWKECDGISTFMGGVKTIDLPGKVAAWNSAKYSAPADRRRQRDARLDNDPTAYSRNRTINPYEIAIKFDKIFAEDVSLDSDSADIFESHSLAWRMDPTEWGSNNTTRPTQHNSSDRDDASSYEPLPDIFSTDATRSTALQKIYGGDYSPLYNISSAGVLTAGIRIAPTGPAGADRRIAYQSMTGSDIDSMSRGERLSDTTQPGSIAGNFVPGNNDIIDVDWPFQKILGAPLPKLNETETEYAARVKTSTLYSNTPGYPNGTYKLLLNSTLLRATHPTHPLYMTDGAIERYPMRVSNPWKCTSAGGDDPTNGAYTSNQVFNSNFDAAKRLALQLVPFVRNTSKITGVYDTVSNEFNKVTATPLPASYWTRTISSGNGNHDASIRSNNRFVHDVITDYGIFKLAGPHVSNHHLTALANGAGVAIIRTNDATSNREVNGSGMPIKKWIPYALDVDGNRPYAFELYRDNESIQARTAANTIGIDSGSATDWYDAISTKNLIRDTNLRSTGFYTSTTSAALQKMLGEATNNTNTLLGQERVGPDPSGPSDPVDGTWEDYDVQLLIDAHLVDTATTPAYLSHTSGDVPRPGEEGYIAGRACFRIDSNYQPEENAAGEIIKSNKDQDWNTPDDWKIPSDHKDTPVPVDGGVVCYVPGDRDDFNIFSNTVDYRKAQYGWDSATAKNKGSVPYIDIRPCRLPIGVNDSYQSDVSPPAGALLGEDISLNNTDGAIRGPWGDNLTLTSSDFKESEFHTFIGGYDSGGAGETACCITDKSTRPGSYSGAGSPADNPHPTSRTSSGYYLAEPFLGNNLNIRKWTAKQRRMKGYNGKGQKWKDRPVESIVWAGVFQPSDGGALESGAINNHAWKPTGIFQRGQRIEGFHTAASYAGLSQGVIYKMTAAETTIVAIQALDVYGFVIKKFPGAAGSYAGEQPIFGRGNPDPASDDQKTPAGAGDETAYFKLEDGTPIFGLRLWLSNKTLETTTSENSFPRSPVAHTRYPGIIQTFWPTGRGELSPEIADSSPYPKGALSEAIVSPTAKWWPADSRSNSKKWGIPSDLMGGNINSATPWDTVSLVRADDPMNFSTNRPWNKFQPGCVEVHIVKGVPTLADPHKLVLLTPLTGTAAWPDLDSTYYDYPIPNPGGLRDYGYIPLRISRGATQFWNSYHSPFLELSTDPIPNIENPSGFNIGKYGYVNRHSITPAIAHFDKFKEKSTHFPWLSDSTDFSDIPMFRLTHRGSQCFNRLTVDIDGGYEVAQIDAPAPAQADGAYRILDGDSTGPTAAKAIHLHKPFKDSVFFVTNRIENNSKTPLDHVLFNGVPALNGDVDPASMMTLESVNYLKTGTSYPITKNGDSSINRVTPGDVNSAEIIQSLGTINPFQGLGYLGGGYDTRRAINQADVHQNNYLSQNQPLSPAGVYPVRTGMKFVGPFAQGGSISRSSAAMGAYGMLFPPRLSNTPDAGDSAYMHKASTFMRENSGVNGLLALGYNVDTAASSIVPFYERVCNVGHRVRTAGTGLVIDSSTTNSGFSAKKYESGYYATFPALSDWPFRNSLRFKGHFEEYKFVEPAAKSTEFIKFTAHNCAFSRSILSPVAIRFKYQKLILGVWTDVAPLNTDPCNNADPRTIAIGASSRRTRVSTTQFSSLGQYAYVSTLFQLDHCGGFGGSFRKRFGQSPISDSPACSRSTDSPLYNWSLAMAPSSTRTWFTPEHEKNVILDKRFDRTPTGLKYPDYFQIIHGTYAEANDGQLNSTPANAPDDMPDSGIRYYDTHDGTFNFYDSSFSLIQLARRDSIPRTDLQVRCVNNIKWPGADTDTYPYYDKTIAGGTPWRYDPDNWEINKLPKVKVDKVDSTSWFWPNSALPAGHPNLAKASNGAVTRPWPKSTQVPAIHTDTTVMDYREVNNTERIIVPADSMYHKFNAEADNMIGPAWVTLKVINGNFVEEFPWSGNLTLGTHTAAGEWTIPNCPGAPPECEDGFHQNVPGGQCFKDCADAEGGANKVDRGDGTSSKCECENQADASTCTGESKWSDAKCECEDCDDCTSPKTRVSGTCECECPSTMSCPQDKELNAECECEDIPCNKTEDDCTCDEDFDRDNCECVSKSPPIVCEDREFKNDQCECVQCDQCDDNADKQDRNDPADLDHCCECIQYLNATGGTLKVPYWTSPSSTELNPIFPRKEDEGGPYMDLGQSFGDFECLCDQGTVAGPSGLIWSKSEEDCVCRNPSDVYNEVTKKCEPCNPNVACAGCLANENLDDCCPCPAGHGRYILGQPDTTDANLCLCRPCENIAVYIDNTCTVKIGDYLCPKCFTGTPSDDGSGSPCIKIQNFCCPNPTVACDFEGGPENWPAEVCINVCGMPPSGEWWVTSTRPTYAIQNFIDVTLKVDGELEPTYNIFHEAVNTGSRRLQFNEIGTIIPPTLILKTRAGAAFNYPENSWAAGVFGPSSIQVPANNSLKFYDPNTFNIEYIYPNITDILNPDGSIKTTGFALYSLDYTPDMRVQFKVDNSIVHIDDLHTYVEGCQGEEVDYADGSGYTFNFTTINPHYSTDEDFRITSCLNQEWREGYERWIMENIPAANAIFGSVANVAFASANNTATGRNATHSYSKLLEFGSNDISTSISISAHDALALLYPPTPKSILADDSLAKLSYAEYEYNLNLIKSSIKIIKPEHINEFAQLYRTTIND